MNGTETARHIAELRAGRTYAQRLSRNAMARLSGGGIGAYPLTGGLHQDWTML